jgi:mono/diheme cytochrome c family protein
MSGHDGDKYRARRRMRGIARLSCLALMATLIQSAACAADEDIQPFASSQRFLYKDGEHLYRAICQGCHMQDGKGAQGAGAYPALAANPRLASGLYPVSVVWNGKNGMPPVGHYLDDAQIAAVVNYVRTHFGNSYADNLSAADVKKISNRP